MDQEMAKHQLSDGHQISILSFEITFLMLKISLNMLKLLKQIINKINKEMIEI
jgi:hypothetical protein